MVCTMCLHFHCVRRTHYTSEPISHGLILLVNKCGACCTAVSLDASHCLISQSLIPVLNKCVTYSRRTCKIHFSIILSYVSNFPPPQRGLSNISSAFTISFHTCHMRRSQWPRGLRRRSAAARLLRLWVRIPPGGMDVCLFGVLCFVR